MGVETSVHAQVPRRLLFGAGLALIAIVAWRYGHRTRPWPDEVRRNTVRSCTYAAGKAPNPLSAEQSLQFCECVLAGLEQRLSYEQYAQEEARMRANQMKLPPVMEAVMAACRTD